MPEPLIVDASAVVDLLAGTELGPTVGERLRGHDLHAPAHFDAEVLSALGRLERAGRLSPAQVTRRLRHLASAPIERHLLPGLLGGAWRRRRNMRLVDALYVELSGMLEAPLVTTDSGLAQAHPAAELVAPRR